MMKPKCEKGGVAVKTVDIDKKKRNLRMYFKSNQDIWAVFNRVIIYI